MNKLCVVLGLLSATVAHAEIMNTTTPLSPGKVGLGVELQAGKVSSASTGLSLDLHESFGLARGMDFIARQGFGLANAGAGVYLGAGLKFNILKDGSNSPGLAVLVGGHYVTSEKVAGADATLLLDHKFSSVTPYLGLDMNLDFPDSGSDLTLALIGGARFVLGSMLSWFVEGGVNFVGQGFVYLSTGPRITF